MLVLLWGGDLRSEIDIHRITHLGSEQLSSTRHTYEVAGPVLLSSLESFLHPERKLGNPEAVAPHPPDPKHLAPQCLLPLKLCFLVGCEHYLLILTQAIMYEE